MLPHDDERPTGFRKRPLVAPVPFDVTAELVEPVVQVRFLQHCVLGAEVPEAATALDRDPRAGEDHVGTTAQPRNDARVLAEAESPTVQLAA